MNFTDQFFLFGDCFRVAGVFIGSGGVEIAHHINDRGSGVGSIHWRVA